MPITTRDDRFSLINLALASGRVLPNPQVTPFDQGDRQQLLYNYRGILWGAPIVIVSVPLRALVLVGRNLVGRVLSG